LGLSGTGWPALPGWVVYLAAGVTIVSLCIALLYRLTDPVLRLISRAGDYLAWILTMLPMLTGNPAKALRLPSYGIEPGKDADLVLLDTRKLADVIIDLPDRNFVVKRGRVVAKTERRVDYAF